MSEPRHIRTSQGAHSSAGGETQGRKINRVQEAGGHGAAPAPHYDESGRKKRKKMAWWLPLVVVLCVVGAAVGVVLGYVNNLMQAISPDSGAAVIAEQVKTAEEYKGDVVGVLVCGIDYEETRTYGTGDNDSDVNDGMTDMIMYFQFDVKNSKINMLQIPRNTLVGSKFTCADTTGNTYKASNGQINSVMLSNQDGMAALADVIANNYKLPVDYYATIDMDALKEIVDRFGGIDVYVPFDMSYGGSSLEQGYHTLMGNDVEFLVRNRKSDIAGDTHYATSDLARLNVQRFFYAALFKRARTANMAEIIKLTPVVTYYVKTSIDASTLISLGLSFLKVDSADILVCQTPVLTASENYKIGTLEQSVVVPARTEIADLLNSYFRTYTGEVAADELNLADDLIGTTGGATSANVQYMGQVDQQVDEAIQSGDTDVYDYSAIINQAQQDLAASAAAG